MNKQEKERDKNLRKDRVAMSEMAAGVWRARRYVMILDQTAKEV
jgi:hypothetical protein